MKKLFAAGSGFRLKTIYRYKWPAVLLCVGFLFMAGASVYENVSEHGDKSGAASPLFSQDGGNSGNKSGNAEDGDFAAYARYEEQRLAELLSKIEGVGTVKVAVYVTSTPVSVPLTDKDSETSRMEENDGEGGSRVTESNADKSDTVYNAAGNVAEAYVSFPEIKGVLIFAEGASRASVKESIIKAVAALYGIPVHSISVLS